MMCMWNATVPGSRPRPSFQWENLTRKLSLTKWHFAGLSEVFKNSPSLKTLSIYIYPGYHDRFKVPKFALSFLRLLPSTAPNLRGMILQREVPGWIKHLVGGENFWDSQEATLSRLEIITVCGYVDDPYVI